MKKTILVLLTLIFGMVLSQWNITSVGAQESDIHEFTLEEITVTAEKREENLQAVPRSSAVITADDIQLRSASATVADILLSTAGINIQGFNTQIFMRGVGPAGNIMNEEGQEPNVQFNVDGNLGMMSGGVNVIETAMNDVERIEIIRGPAGAINGRMAAAGTINVITKDPDFDRIDANVGVMVGNYDTMNTSAATNIPLKLTGWDLPAFIENLSFRIAVKKDKHSCYAHNADGEGTGGYQNFYTQRIKMKWQPIESVTVKAHYEYTRDKSSLSMMVPAIDQVQTFPGMSTPHPEDPWLNARGRAFSTIRSAKESYSDSLEISWANRFGKLTGRYGKSWVPQKCEDRVDISGAEEANICYEGDVFQDEYEVRMNSLEDSRIEWMVGYYQYYKKEYAGPEEQFEAIDPNATDIFFQNFYGATNYFNQMGIDVLSPDFDANNPDRPWAIEGLEEVTPDSVAFISNSGTRPVKSHSYYGNITIPFFEDRHRFSLGLRKTVEDKTRMTLLGIFGTGGDELVHFTFVPSEVDPTQGMWVADNLELLYEEKPHIMATTDNPLSYTVGWEYDWKPEVLLYLNVNNGFKPGGVTSEAIPSRLYDPEYLTAYALGMRSRWFNNTLQINAEAYLMDYDNLQTTVTSESTIEYTIGGTTYSQPYGFNMVTVNLDKTYIKGMDLDFDWLITSRDRLKGTIAIKDAKYGAYEYHLGLTGVPEGHPEWINFDGRPMPHAPKFSFTANYSHQFTIGNMMVTPRFDVKYSTKYIVFNNWWWEAVGSEVWQPDYWKYDAYLNIGPEDGNWQINAYVKNIDETPVRTVSFMFMQIEAPRTMGVGLTVRF